MKLEKLKQNKKTNKKTSKAATATKKVIQAGVHGMSSYLLWYLSFERASAKLV